MDQKQLRRALGSFVSGVTVITSVDTDERPIGVTVSSFCSLSLDPPMVLWCIARTARTADRFIRADRFAAHVLAHDQWALAELFATQGADKFGRTPYRLLSNGLPVITGCAAHFACTLRDVFEGGDHFILTGEIDDFAVSDTEPLAYRQGRYALTHRGDQAEHLIALQSW